MAVNVVVGDGPATTVPTVVLLLVHTPPAVELLSVVVAPGHNDVMPDMAPGDDVTVTKVVV